MVIIVAVPPILDTFPKGQLDDLYWCEEFLLWLFTTLLANKMGFSELWQYFKRENEFHALETESHCGSEEDVESEKLLTRGRLARKSGHPRAWIYLTIANVIILSITIFLVFTATRSLPGYEKNAVLRPISWWCKFPLPSRDCFLQINVTIGRYSTDPR